MTARTGLELLADRRDLSLLATQSRSCYCCKHSSRSGVKETKLSKKREKMQDLRQHDSHSEFSQRDNSPGGGTPNPAKLGPAHSRQTLPFDFLNQREAGLIQVNLQLWKSLFIKFNIEIFSPFYYAQLISHCFKLFQSPKKSASSHPSWNRI